MPRETIHQYLLRRLASCDNQTALARRAGMAQSTMSRIATGRGVPRLDQAQKLLDAFEKDDRAAAASGRRSKGSALSLGARSRGSL